MRDFMLYVTGNIDRRLATRLTETVEHHTAWVEQVTGQDGVTYAGQTNEHQGGLRRALWAIDWGDVRGVLIVHTIIKFEDEPDEPDQEQIRVHHMPEYPAPQVGRVYPGPGTRDLVPGRCYTAPDGVTRIYDYEEGGREGWRWVEEVGTERVSMTAHHHEIDGPYVESNWRTLR